MRSDHQFRPHVGGQATSGAGEISAVIAASAESSPGASGVANEATTAENENYAAETSAIQLANLSGVLCSLSAGAELSRERVDYLKRVRDAFRTSSYTVDAASVSRRLIDDLLLPN